MKRDEKVTGQISLIYIQMSLIYIQISFRLVIVVDNSKNILCPQSFWKLRLHKFEVLARAFSHTPFVETLHERFL